MNLVFNQLPRTTFYLIVLIICALATPSLAQENEQLVVTTIAEVRANGDITVTDNGDIYIADFGNPSLGNGSTVVRVTPEGEGTVFTSGLSAAASGITHDAAGNIYVATLNGGDVYRISPNGTQTRINSNLLGPVGLAFDNNNNLYVAECSGNRISRLVNGTAQTLAVIGGIGCANGIVWGHDNAFYVLMWQDGNVFRVDLAGNVTLFSDIPGGGGHIEFYQGHYYALSRTNHSLYRIDTNGNATLFAGTGVDGNQDGPIETATLSRPNGIGVDQSTGAFYLTGSSDFANNQIPIRKIAAQAVEPENDFVINSGLAGSWFEPSLNGQGVVFDFAVSEDRFDAVMYWFTFDDVAADVDTELTGFGSRQHRWFTALGPVNGATVVMPVFRTANGEFNQSVPVTVDEVGEARVEFLNCFEAVLDFEFFVPESKTGSIDLQRLTPDINCESLLNSTSTELN